MTKEEHKPGARQYRKYGEELKGEVRQLPEVSLYQGDRKLGLSGVSVQYRRVCGCS
jgi:hypothetical protein